MLTFVERIFCGLYVSYVTSLFGFLLKIFLLSISMFKGNYISLQQMRFSDFE